MSYILDALKQNETSSRGAAPMQGDYQQEYLLSKKLRFYRNLALFLGFLLTLTLGFFIGKGLQTQQTKPAIESEVVQSKATSNNQVTMPLQPQVPATSGTQQQIQYQLVPVPVYTQPMAANAQPVVEPTPSEKSQPKADENAQGEADLSEYKVVGYQQAKEQREQTNALIDAFSEAFEQAQNEPLEQQVISGSSASAQVSPIQLLPEAFRARIPEMRYQAHVFASEPSRSWIKINDRELKVGDNINGVYIIDIAAEQTLMQYDGVEFSLAAMEDWQF
ncbi:general secretion pathway protein GspB [Pseudoalteromonas spongiae]|uniref:General secretion pathway protein GspB n=1 Tax=Pseudoalteromonas spongiae TaxID=298657 RepID=A0ABU8EQQ0_9GAMM